MSIKNIVGRSTEIAFLEEIFRSKDAEFLSIQDLSRKIEKKTGGTFTKKLAELEAAGFIQKYLPYGRRKRDQYYRVIDEYSYFYLSWIEPYKEREILDAQSNYWHLASQTPAWKSWSGYAFESVCYKHINKIREVLGLNHIHCHIGSWRYVPQKGEPKTGAQIDLLIEREDGILNICEMKYSDKKLVVDKAMARNFMQKMDVYEQQFKTTKQILFVIVTTVGVKRSIWSEDLIDNLVILDDLF